MTLGALRLRLSKLAPGVDLELLNGWIQDRYTEILDRLPWQRLEVTAPLATVATQPIYTLPAACRIVDGIVHPELGPLQRMSPAELDAFAPGRGQSGPPRIWAPAMDDTSDPPLAQVELYPVPDRIVNLVLRYTADADALSGTSTSVLPWVRPAALIEGATANVKRHLKDYTGAELAERRFEKLVSQMLTNEALRVGPGRTQMAGRYTQHRIRRRAR